MLYYNYWHFTNCWNQTPVLHSKYIATFSTVLSAPINHDHSVYLYNFVNVWESPLTCNACVPYVLPEHSLLASCSRCHLYICKCGCFHDPEHKPCDARYPRASVAGHTVSPKRTADTVRYPISKLTEFTCSGSPRGARSQLQVLLAPASRQRPPSGQLHSPGISWRVPHSGGSLQWLTTSHLHTFL